MDSSVSPKDEIWFLRVCHHISTGLYCVTVAFNLTEQAHQRQHDNAPAHSTALVLDVLAKHHITQFCQPPYSPDLAPCDFWLFPKLKSMLKGRRFVKCDRHTVHKLSQRRLTAN
jgi:transposase